MDSELHADTSWCPVCDRAIAPRRIQIPVDALPTRASHSQTRPATSSSPSDHLPRQPKLRNAPNPRLSRLANTGGLVNGTGRGLRRHDRPQPPSASLRMKEIIAQEPTPYYCSDECRKQDIANELERLQLSQPRLSRFGGDFLINDDDDPLPLHVPHNTPATEDMFSPPSPLFISSGTDSDSDSVPNFNDASYSPRRPVAHLLQAFSSKSTRNNHPSVRPRPRQLDSLDRKSSSSRVSTESASSPETSLHPLLSASFKGKILVPSIISSLPTRTNSFQSVSSSSKRESGNAVASKIPIQPSQFRPEKATVSLSYDGQFTYPMPSFSTKEKREVRVWVPSPNNKCGVKGIGEGRWEVREVEVTRERKRLFLFTP